MTVRTETLAHEAVSAACRLGLSRLVWLGATLAVLPIAGCMAHGTATDVAAVNDWLRERSPLVVPQPGESRDSRDSRDTVDGDDGSEEVRKLVREPLTLDHAVRIALLNNRELTAELLRLGVARGQLVQANLLPELEFDFAVRFPGNDRHTRSWEVGAGFDLTQLILRGARSEVARAELEAARIRVAGAVLDLRYRVRLSYFDVQVREQQLELMRTAMQAFGASYDTARELERAGNVTELDVATEQTAYEGARVMVAEAEADVIDAHERLNVLLGLFGREIDWQIAARLPDPTEPDPDLAQLEQRAIGASLELAETRSSLLALVRQAGLSAAAGTLPDLSVGVSAERHEGYWVVGPAVHGSLPLFDRQRGTRISVEARAAALRESYQAEAITIRAITRAARDRMVSARKRVHQYRETVLPLRERVVHQSVLQYNAMQIGVFQLLQARRDQLEAGRNYLSTLLEYWRARAALEQLVSGRMASTLENVTQGARTGESAFKSGSASVGGGGSGTVAH